MTELDKALEQCERGIIDQSDYYELFLNSNFYVPIINDDETSGIDSDESSETIAPVLLTEGEGKASVLLFDTEEKLNTWTNGAVGYQVLPGHVVVEMVKDERYLSLNIGSRSKKEFIPEEIAYLKKVVQSVRAEMSTGE